MKRVPTPEVLEGPSSLWKAARYFYGQPEVGLVAIRNLLDTEQVASVRRASRSPSVVTSKLNMPNVAATRTSVYASLISSGIMPDTLEAMNQDFWDPNAILDLKLDECLLTRFGKSVAPHTDVLSGNRRPIGVSVSISIGKCTFAAALPPAEMRTLAGATEEEYDDWRLGAVRTTDVLHFAELEAGDAALWLQPGVHEARTSDPNRFGCLYITDTQQ